MPCFGLGPSSTRLSTCRRAPWWAFVSPGIFFAGCLRSCIRSFTAITWTIIIRTSTELRPMENICHWPRLPSERPSSTSHRFRFCRFLPSAAFVSASPPATMVAGTRVLVWNESLLSAHHPANGTSGPLGCAGLILLPVVSRRYRSGSHKDSFRGRQSGSCMLLRPIRSA